MIRFVRKWGAALVAAMGMLAFVTPNAQAWWGGGHMAIAILAYREMKPTTQTAVDALLKTHPDYAEWQKEMPSGISDMTRRSYIFAIAATWPDRIKDHRDKSVLVQFYDDGDKGGLPNPVPTDPRYPDLAMHKEWHYVDIPISTDGKLHEVPPGDNALTEIPICRDKVATTNLSDSFRAYYLAWLEHLVGDIHQPLHAAGRFSNTYPDGDQGGNAVKLEHAGPKDPTNLHGYWDGLLGDGGDGPGGYAYPTDWKALEATVAAVAADAPRLLSGYSIELRNDVKPDDWARESYAIDQDFVYTIGPDVPGPLPQPDAAYHETALRFAHERAALAGHRLATMLDAIFNKTDQ